MRAEIWEEMYIVVNSHLDKNHTVYYSSLAGKFAGQQTETGIEENSSVLRGTLHAILQGIRKIEGGFGSVERHRIDVLVVVDESIAKQLRERSAVSKILHSDDDELWSQLLAKKECYDIRFITSHADSHHIQVIWKWSSTPPQPAEL
jgi:hypothetical protein